jgi:hypothetical protein
MIALIALKLMEAGLGPKVAKASAWAILIALAVSVLFIGKCTYDGRIVARHEAKVTGRTLATDAKAKDAAAEQRARDTITIDTAEKERHDAIHSKPAGRPDAARNRLNCDRLRRAGFDTAGHPECS